MEVLQRPGHTARPAATGSRVRSWRGSAHAREFALVGGAYLLYMLIRQLIAADIQGVAFIHAESVVNLEKDLGFFWEPALQGWAINTSDFLVVFFNWAYILTFYPIILTASVILYMKSRRRYRHYRNVVLLSFVFALAAFAIFPLAPPRMLTRDFVDTMAIFGPSIYSGAEGASFYNAFAAMPSLHFGWSVLFATIFFRSGNRFLRIFAFVYPSMMLFTIVVTGNHYFLDAIAGGLVILVSFGTVNAIGAIRRGEVDARQLIPTSRRSLVAIGEMCWRQPERGVLTRSSQPEKQVTGQRQYDRNYQHSVYVSTVW
ncbi:MAG: phosphatase PAP2 family protein [Dehalococcoidia bacterium]|nr:phosphatase PAP2 family protein [Dehalococcoidia bacterium]